MLYLAKTQRFFGDHQYIIGVFEDENIAHFVAKYHCKFTRAGKYDYTIEKLTHIAYKECFIVSWENDDETLRYRVYECEDHAEKVPGYEENYRYSAQTYVPEDLSAISGDELKEAAEVWYYFEGKELLGLHKLYSDYRDTEFKKHMGLR
jgi:hypothetical protein